MSYFVSSRPSAPLEAFPELTEREILAEPKDGVQPRLEHLAKLQVVDLGAIIRAREAGLGRDKL